MAMYVGGFLDMLLQTLKDQEISRHHHSKGYRHVR